MIVDVQWEENAIHIGCSVCVSPVELTGIARICILK